MRLISTAGSANSICTSLEKIRWDEEFSTAARESVHAICPQENSRFGPAHAGGVSLVRDAADQRLVEGDAGKYRMIDSQDQVGGWPILQSKPAPLDTDGDGIPDDWERAHGLNPNDPHDGNLRDKDGYTNLEKYMNSLCPAMP